MNNVIRLALLALLLSACKTPALVTRTENRSVPASFGTAPDSVTTARLRWRDFFTDPDLVALIDTALTNNQELNITRQEIEIARNEVSARRGEYLPSVGLSAAAGAHKAGRYTLQGATEAITQIRPGQYTPDPLPNFLVGAFASWEVDIWQKLRTAQRAAATRYLATNEGRNFMVTNLVSEIASTYYELLALDAQLAIVRQSIDIQTNALEIVKLQKESARTTELAVRRFEAQVQHTRSLQFDIQQRIVEAENRINFLIGRYPQPVRRNRSDFEEQVPPPIHSGMPSQLLTNRPDIRQAELNLAAARLDVRAARAAFYPSLNIEAGIGMNAFNPALLVSTPESLLLSLVGGLTAPWINRLTLKASYLSANARQTQTVYAYEQTVLRAYIEVANQLAKIDNLEKSYALKANQVQALNQSTTIANTLFRSARADYMEVLMTQRDALESKVELVETRLERFQAVVGTYRALGGGWNN
jgi:multidrug efflux system outer membrane protein